jgi:hypothetical protein
VTRERNKMGIKVSEMRPLRHVEEVKIIDNSKTNTYEN